MQKILVSIKRERRGLITIAECLHKIPNITVIGSTSVGATLEGDDSTLALVRQILEADCYVERPVKHDYHI